MRPTARPRRRSSPTCTRSRNGDGFFNTGPSNTILANVTLPRVRASAFAINIFVIHTLGDAVSPPIIGYLKDIHSWELGFVLMAVVILLGGVLWLMGARYLARDTAVVEQDVTDVVEQT
jgi:MFS transporter, Spinster family, sphingosine-1-phosphate transporter